MIGTAAVRGSPLIFLATLERVLTRHDHVHHHDGRAHCGQDLQGRRRVFGLQDVVVVRPQQTHETAANARIVIHQENARSHARALTRLHTEDKVNLMDKTRSE